MPDRKNGMVKFRKPFKLRYPKGQSFIEFALLLPLLIVLILAMVEFGFLMNNYMAILDATRNAARFSSDSLYNHRDGLTDCDTTTDFYMQTACIVIQELAQEQPTIELDPAKGDDIVITAIGVLGGTPPSITARFPSNIGWSYAQAITGTRNHSTSYTDAQITALLRNGTPSTGFIIVELYHNYDLKLGLSWLLPFLPNPIPFHSRAVMPLVSAEPTPTPEP
jgi:hypothetical protein